MQHLVRLPDGSVKRSEDAVRCALKLGGLHTVADCLVVDLDGIDTVLGLSWLSKHKAKLDCAARTCELQNANDQRYTLKPPAPSSNACKPILSAMQVKRAIVRGCKAFWVHVKLVPAPASVSQLNSLHEGQAELDDDTAAGVLHVDKPMQIEDGARCKGAAAGICRCLPVSPASWLASRQADLPCDSHSERRTPPLQAALPLESC